jgi:LPS-assembly protein
MPDRIEATGNIRFDDETLRISSQSLAINGDQDAGYFLDTRFQVMDQHLRGSAARIEQLDADHQLLQQVTFTTCDPGDDAWSLDAQSLEIDHATRQGTARDAVLRIQSVPVFYFPWVMFPVGDDRMSGILSPTIGNSSDNGTFVSLPVYWNIADNYDMTITPVNFSDRGFQLNTENRYLFKDHAGVVQYSTLDDDSTGTERWYRGWRHRAQLPGGVSASLNLQRVSDTEFLEDFDDGDLPGDIDFLPSSVQFRRGFGEWKGSVLFKEFQILNLSKPIEARPYEVKPRISLDLTPFTEPNRLNFRWRNQLTRFERDESINGNRLRMTPVVNYPIEDVFYFIKPQLQLDLTRYQLDPRDDQPEDIDRTLPLVSIDSGLIFERSVGQNDAWLQTLEPRLYLLYVPYEDQSDIPDFDTSRPLESFNGLFRNNRFNGGDRIGDAQQVSLGITTRFLEPEKGREVFSASIGQAFYLDDRRVNIRNTVPDESDKSGFISRLQYRPSEPWLLGLGNVFDDERDESVQTDIALRYHNLPVLFNLEYHYRKNDLEQTTLSTVYPLSDRWTGFFKRQHSIRKDRPVHNLVGAAYESCCWEFQVLYEEESNEQITETDYAFYLQLTFKGFSSAGRNVSTIVRDGILGY